MALNNSQYDMIHRTYEEAQTRNHAILENRRREIFSKIPEYAELQSEISDLGLTQARKMLEGDENALKEHGKQMKKITGKKAELLAAFGYPKDYLDPIYDCPDCKDTGYIGNEKCHCFQRAIIDMLYTQSNLKRILEKENFDTFSFSYFSDNYKDPTTGRTALETIKEAHTIAKDFVANFGKDFRNLFLYGDTGVGKTFLTNCIAKELIDRSFSVIYFTSYDLFDTLAKEKFGKNEEAEPLSKYILDCDLLIIDDLGTELANSFTTSQFFLCLNERLLHQKSTIISTNLSLKSIVDLYSERSFSRIMSNYITLRLTGDDIRIKKKLRNREDM